MIYPQAWKTAKGILLRKPSKPNYSMAKAYRVISLLNYMGKIKTKVKRTLEFFVRRAEDNGK
jgi:hypothetical protein